MGQESVAIFDTRPGRRLVAAEQIKRFRCHDLAGDAHTCNQPTAINFLGQELRLNYRRRSRIRVPYMDGTPRRRTHRVHADGHAWTVFKPASRSLPIASWREMELKIGHRLAR